MRLSLILLATVNACTRLLYETGDGNYIVGRSMDWFECLGSDLWSFPREMSRDGGTGPKALAWTSKYGSVVVDAYDIAATDGMNEKGLVGNVLYLAEAEYGDADPDKPQISIGAWLQYILDSFATVAEAVAAGWKSNSFLDDGRPRVDGVIPAQVAALENEPFVIIAPMLPNGKTASAHISLADDAGDSAIFEYVDGRLVVHHGSGYAVMTNSPTFDKQLAITAYWEEVGGLNALPGTHRAADRFARASWNLAHVPHVNGTLAVATVFSLIRGVSVPLGITDPDKPNIASTLWRTVSDTGARRYFFESSFATSVFWVDVPKLDLAPGAAPRKLAVSAALAGEVSGAFVPAEPFTYLNHHAA